MLTTMLAINNGKALLQILRCLICTFIGDCCVYFSVNDLFLSQVHEISVGTVEIKPDPVTVQLNDIVCWVFRGLRFHDVYLVENADQVLAKKFTGDPVPPR